MTTERFLTLKEAAPLFGYPSADAIRRAFERKILPDACLVRIGSRTLRVDVTRLTEWLRNRKAHA